MLMPTLLSSHSEIPGFYFRMCAALLLHEIVKKLVSARSAKVGNAAKKIIA